MGLIGSGRVWVERGAGIEDLVTLGLNQCLSLPAVVSVMLSGDTAWRAVATFCEKVMVQKEAAERERERENGSHPEAGPQTCSRISSWPFK
ncbi:unnamed protein product, partial [Iphiclides podalirius]